MIDILKNILRNYQNNSIAIYGLGIETERFLAKYGKELNIVGLLDGFLSEGKQYGYPIISLEDILQKTVSLVLVIARPGSCKVIAKRIGNFCIQNNIELYDIRGNNLLEVKKETYDFSSFKECSKDLLWKSMKDADIVSFDLFDTLVTRKVFSYMDIFEVMDYKLRDMDIIIPDFPQLRLFAEKELSKYSAPKLIDIYHLVLEKSGGNFITAYELAKIEKEIDFSTVVARNDMIQIFNEIVSTGKKVVITTDSYYSINQINILLNQLSIKGAENIFVSSDFGTSKTQNLFTILKNNYPNKKIIHIGDDEFADIEKASQFGINSFRIYSGTDLFYHLGGLGIEKHIHSLSDRVKVGLFVSNIFNEAFCTEYFKKILNVNSAFQIGYLFCAPMITDFVIWLKKTVIEQEYKQILFCSRDGYLPGKLFKMIETGNRAVYFLTSRTAAIRSGMRNVDDIRYVDSMKYFGSEEQALKMRFGITTDDMGSLNRTDEIIYKSKVQRENYHKYIEKLYLEKKPLAMFDFVAKGTTQLYLQRLFTQHMKGFYFLQLEPEFMSHKDLDIEPFYTDEEKNSSAIFENYYILETILTSPYPQVVEMKEGGVPVFAQETRRVSDIKAVEKAQRGITEYFMDYITMLPESARTENKELDEKMLELINKVQILDEDFLALKVEDPFFGRMTDVKDVIG